MVASKKFGRRISNVCAGVSGRPLRELAGPAADTRFLQENAANCASSRRAAHRRKKNEKIRVALRASRF
jgi:hypothetical protein